MKFKPYVKRDSKPLCYDLNRTIKKGGVDYNFYEVIQKGRQDTELYKTLELYGCIDKMTVDPNKVYGDFQEFKDLRSMHDQMNKAQEMWNNLPYDVRMKFNNNMHTFVNEGEKYIKDLLDAEKAKTEAQVQQPVTEGENNG